MTYPLTSMSVVRRSFPRKSFIYKAIRAYFGWGTLHNESNESNESNNENDAAR